MFFSDGEVIEEPVRRRDVKRKEFRHAQSEMLPDEVHDDRRQSQAMIDIKAHAFKRLKDELQTAQTVCIYIHLKIVISF